MLRLTVYRDFSKLYRFANVEQRKFLALYFKRYEVSVIKECLNTVFDHRDVVLNLSIFDEFFNKHSQLDINLLASSRTIEELIANLKGTEYYAPLSQLADIERPTLFDYEMTPGSVLLCTDVERQIKSSDKAGSGRADRCMGKQV